MIRWRWPVQIVMLVLFCAFAALASAPGRVPFNPSAWLIADPLVALVGVVSAKTVWVNAAYAVVIIAATFIVGRFFCGWLCPLGTILDLTDRILRPRRSPMRKDELRPRARWKHLVLVALVVSALFGVSTGLILDPLVLMTRSIVLLFVPLAVWTGYAGVHAVRFVPGWGSFGVAALESPPLYAEMTAVALVFVGIVLLGAVERRFWCRNLCPLGAILSVLSRTGLIRRYVGGECSACTLCARDCPMGAIPAADFTQTHSGECIQCLRCQEVCTKAAVKFGIAGEHAAPAFVPERRQALAIVGASVGLGLLGGATTHAAPRPAHVIRPPGALPEEEFQSRCTRCLACVQACPTHGLQPLALEAGWEALWSPYLKPVVGGCEEPCHDCTQVCPTGAIRELTHEEKSFAKIGTARIFQERCLAWEQVKPCLVCDEVCPYNAIRFITITDYRGIQRRPVVTVEKCIGCGLCEYACPVREPRAIVVEYYGEERFRDGSYVTDRKRSLRQADSPEHRDVLDEQVIGGEAPSEADSLLPPSLPPGFIFE